MQLRIEVGTGLGLVIEEGVAAADVGLQGVVYADAVAQGDAVLFAGAAAVGEVGAGGKKGGKGAVLHVKHGHVLMKGDLEPGGVGSAKEIEDLLQVEVVGKGQPLQRGLTLQQGGGQVIGDVEREVARETKTRVFKEADGAEVPDEDAMGLGALDELEEASLAGLLNAGGGEEDLGFRTGGAYFGDGVGVAADVFEVEVEAGDAESEGGVDLLGRAAQSVEGGVARECGRLQAGCLRLLWKSACAGWVGADRSVRAPVAEFVNEFAAEAVELGERENEGRVQLEGDGAELVGCASEAAELVAKRGFVERTFLGKLKGDAGTHGDTLGAAVEEMGGGSAHGESRVFTAGGGDIEPPLLANGDVAFKGLP